MDVVSLIIKIVLCLCSLFLIVVVLLQTDENGNASSMISGAQVGIALKTHQNSGGCLYGFGSCAGADSEILLKKIENAFPIKRRFFIPLYQERIER